MQRDFKLYKVDMKYIRNLHKIDDKVLSVSPQTGKENRAFIGIVMICGNHKYCIPLSSPKSKHQNMRNSMDFSKIEVDGKLLGVLNFNLMYRLNYTRKLKRKLCSRPLLERSGCFRVVVCHLLTETGHPGRAHILQYLKARSLESGRGRLR
jgi:hypothetical protein